MSYWKTQKLLTLFRASSENNISQPGPDSGDLTGKWLKPPQPLSGKAQCFTQPLPHRSTYLSWDTFSDRRWIWVNILTLLTTKQCCEKQDRTFSYPAGCVCYSSLVFSRVASAHFPQTPKPLGHTLKTKLILKLELLLLLKRYMSPQKANISKVKFIPDSDPWHPCLHIHIYPVNCLMHLNWMKTVSHSPKTFVMLMWPISDLHTSYQPRRDLMFTNKKAVAPISVLCSYEGVM